MKYQAEMSLSLATWKIKVIAVIHASSSFWRKMTFLTLLL